MTPNFNLTNYETVEDPLSNGGNFSTHCGYRFYRQFKICRAVYAEPHAVTVNDASLWTGKVVKTGDSWPVLTNIVSSQLSSAACTWRWNLC